MDADLAQCTPLGGLKSPVALPPADRRSFFQAGALMAGAVVSLSTLTDALAADAFKSLKKSPRMPVVFVGHGSPMNAIGDNAYRRSWQTLGTEFGSRYPAPQLILCVSAHWLTQGGWYLTGMDKPRTIHDFGGFPQELFDQQYPAPGAPLAAAEIAKTIKQPTGGAAVGLDRREWGFDHGTWSVLKPMFPKAEIPVLQLSMDYSRPPSEHFQLGQQLKALRDRGVLIIGSGNLVHNLRTMRRDAAPSQAFDWAIEFDKVVTQQIAQGQLSALAEFQKLGSVAARAHPSHEHFLPLLYAAGAVDAKAEAPRFFNADFQGASISMRSVVWG